MFDPGLKYAESMIACSRVQNSISWSLTFWCNLDSPHCRFKESILDGVRWGGRSWRAPVPVGKEYQTRPTRVYRVPIQTCCIWCILQSISLEHHHTVPSGEVLENPRNPCTLTTLLHWCGWYSWWGEEAFELYGQSKQIFQEGGFNLRKFITQSISKKNSKRHNAPAVHLEMNQPIQKQP